MVSHTNKMILSMTILMICRVLYVFSMDWREKNIGTVVIADPENEIDRIKCLEQLNELCKGNQEYSNNLTPNIKKKSSFNIAEMPGNTRIIPYYRSSHHNICSCGMEYKLMELGHTYYPRYLITGVCKSNSCGNHHQCVEKKYKVRVLKQRDFADQDPSEPMGLPANLRESWIAEAISVAVACECVPTVEKYEAT